MTAKLSALEEEIALQIRAAKLPVPIREFYFAPGRRFRFDFAWPALMLALEVDGLTGSKVSGHTSIAGYSRDREKDRIADNLGWRVIRADRRFIKSGNALQYIEQQIERRTNEQKFISTLGA